MDVEPRTEAEQIAFFDVVLARFRQAVAVVGLDEYLLRLAGTTVRLRFAGRRLVPQVVPALAHLLTSEAEGPELTLCLWDRTSTGVDLPPAPCDKSCFTDRGDIWGFTSRRTRTAFHYYDFSVNVLDLERRIGVYCVEGLQTLPYWSQASPVRTLIHWWMEHCGAQLVHAAAVATADGAVLLPGKGGSGKSTTALACLRAGFGYLADDYVVVSLEPRPTVHCLYATAKLDGDKVGAFPELLPHVVNLDRLASQKAVVRLYPDLGQRLVREAPLRAILVPQICDRDDTDVVAADPDEVLHAARFTSMSQLPYAGRGTHEFLGRLCASLPAATLALGRDLADVPRAVRRVLRSGIGRAQPAAVQVGSGHPGVSVVIPVYNGAAFLREAIDSIVQQGYPNLEIVVVDDGSTDATPDVIAGLPVDVRSLRQPNSGAAAARNRGIRDATSDLIAFLDVDDLWAPGSLALMLRALDFDLELDLVRGWAQVTEYDPGTGSYELRGSPAESFPDYIGAALYRKRAFARVGFFDTTLRFAEDVDWFNRARELSIPIRRLDAVTLYVRRHGRNMTHGRSLQELNLLQAFKKQLDRRRSRNANVNLAVDDLSAV